MYESKKTPGKKFGSSFVGKRYDDNTKGDSSSEPVKESKAPIGMTKPAAGSADKEESRTDAMGGTKKTAYPGVEEVDNTADTKAEPEGVDAQSVVAENGPASRVTIHHNHAGGQHTVVSQHGNFQHTSQHASAQDAHKHAAVLGGEANEENTGKAPNEDAGDGDMFGNDGFSTPRLA
jgi:hypothetical protein